MNVTDKTFLLYEALLWEPPDGYFLLDRHLQRLEGSARHFGFSFDAQGARQLLDSHSRGLPAEPRKVRLELAADGNIKLEDEPVKASTPLKAALARTPVGSGDEFLLHKTSRREIFQRALQEQPEAQEILLWNERGELTETCHGNIVVEIQGRKWTPQVNSGLLPGVFRAELLERGEIEEAVLPVSAAAEATAIYMINSVRKWCVIRLV